MTALDIIWKQAEPDAAFWVRVVPRLIVRAALSVMLGVVGATANSALDLTSLSFMEAALMSGCIAAATMTATLGRSLISILWVLMLGGLTIFYQIVLYLEDPFAHPFIRLLPVLLPALLLLLFYRGERRTVGSIVWIWIACHVPAAISGSLNPDLEPSVTAIFLISNVIYPLIFYYAFRSVPISPRHLQVAAQCLSIGILALALAPLILIPFEFSARGQASFAALQVGGRAYATIGAVFLVWPILVTTLSRWRPPVAYIAFAILALLIATSFSRGAILGGAVLALAVVLGRGRRISSLINIVMVATGLTVLMALFVPHWLEDLYRFWLLRANVATNADPTLSVSFSLANFLSSGREDIWRVAGEAFMEQPLLGHGIGSTSSIMMRYTDGAAQYGSMHNLFLTIAVERGIFGLFATFLLFGRMVWIMWSIKDLPGGRLLYLVSFAGFLLFANTTGVELFMNSSREMNMTLAAYAFAYLGYLECQLAANGSRYTDGKQRRARRNVSLGPVAAAPGHKTTASAARPMP